MTLRLQVEILINNEFILINFTAWKFKYLKYMSPKFLWFCGFLPKIMHEKCPFSKYSHQWKFLKISSGNFYSAPWVAGSFYSVPWTSQPQTELIQLDDNFSFFSNYKNCKRLTSRPLTAVAFVNSIHFSYKKLYRELHCNSGILDLIQVTEFKVTLNKRIEVLSLLNFDASRKKFK